MKRRKFIVIVLAMLCTTFACVTSCAAKSIPEGNPDPLPPVELEPGFEFIFDGKTLDGWEAADMTFWSVEDGAITAKITEEKPTERNHYLVYQGGGTC